MALRLTAPPLLEDDAVGSSILSTLQPRSVTGRTSAGERPSRAISLCMKSARKAIGALLLGLGLMTVTQLVSAALLQTNASTGMLTGALNVDIGGLLFDVEFRDGPC